MQRRREQFSSPEELARILKLFDSCQEFDNFDTIVQTAEDKWRSKLNNAAEFRLCRMRFDQGSFPVAIPESIINNVERIRLNSRVTNFLQDERIVVRITNRQFNSRVAEGVIEGRYCVDEKYSMLSKAKISKIIARKPRNFRACQLQLEGSQQGWAVPIEATDELEKVELKGRTNCGRACQGDTVLVEVLDKDEDNPRLGHGRVVGVLKQHEKLVYKLFICELIYDDGSFMRPLCHTFPKIGYDNKHARVWYREQYEQKVKSNQVFRNRRAIGVQNRDERGMEDVEKYANLHYVSVYNPRKRLVDSVDSAKNQKKGKKGQDKRSKDVQGRAQFEFSPYGDPLHVQKHNCDKLFVVCYLSWSVNQFYPTGKVVHVFNRVDSLDSTLEVLMLKHSLPRKMLETPAVKRDLEKIRTIATDTSDHARRKDFRNHFTVTIDNPDTKDMDDAISFQYNEQTRIALVGVHITDVSYYIEKDSTLDKLGQNRVVTVYPPKIAKQAGVTPNHLFPSDLSESLLSLVEGSDRRCLSTVFEFKRDPTGEWDLRRKTPAITLIHSNHRLNKDAVHDILLGRVPDSGGQHSQELITALRYLWSIAKELRIHRMGSAAFVLRDDSEDAESAIGDKFEASALVEEFMVLANRTVGEFLASGKYLEPFVNRVQQPPRDVDVDLWRYRFEFSVVQSAELARHFRNLSVMFDDARISKQNIRIFKDDSRLLQQLCTRDHRSALLMMFSETRFPYLFLAISEWHKISRPASYIEFQPQPPNLHFDLNIENYVHFTSPLRRYPDILVHRALRAQLEAQIQGKVESIDDLAEYMNCVVQRSKRFEKDGQCFEFAELNKTKPQCLLAVVREMSEDEIVFTSKSTEFLPTLSKTVPLRFLSLIEKPAVSNSCTRLQWKKKIFCHPSSERWNSFIKHGINPEKNMECVVSNVEYFDFVDFACVKNLKEQLLHCQGNYDGVRQHCESSAHRIVCEQDENPAQTFFVSSESTLQENSIINNSSHVSKDVRLGDVMKVQFSNFMSGGLLTPTIQMIELCDTIDMCTAHRMRPVASFERIADEASSNLYRDTLHYANVWLPIVAMESATVAAAADDSLVVHDVELQWRWDAKNERHLGLFCLTEQYCQNRLIRFSDSVYHDPNRKEKLEDHAQTGSMKDPTDEAFRIAESIDTLRYAEYICLRSKRDSHTWIGHGGIVSVYICPHTKHLMCGAPKVHICRFIVFHLNEVSCDSSAPQESLKRASIEIIYKFLPSRRQEIALQKLVDIKSDLASKLINLEDERQMRDAVGDWTIYLGHLKMRDVTRYVIRLPAETDFKTYETIPCNESQEEAISRAMTQPVTLIWGPPGTGKTSTGIMLTYWYVFINRCIDDTWAEANDYYDAGDDDDQEDEAGDDEDEADAHVRIRYAELGIVASPRDGKAPPSLSKLKRLPKVAAKGRDKAKQLQTRRQVLYCGPSNASVDVVANYLQNRLRLKCPRIVRVASEQIELRRYPVPGEGAKSKVNAETEISSALEPITLHEIVRVGNGKRARLLKSFDQVFRSFLSRKVKSASAFRNVLVKMLPTLSDLDKYLRDHLKEYVLLTDPMRNEPLQPWDMDLSTVTQLYRSALSDAKQIALQRYEVVLCTTSVSSSGLLQKSCKFSQIIIDEAGMCTQPETLVPVVGYLKAASVSVSVDESEAAMPARLASHFAERLVLIGDHKQLCPIIQNKTAALLGLRKSFLEYQSGNMVMLRFQYRMHPSLADFPAEYFYNVSGADGQPQGPGLQTRCSPSWTGLRQYGNIRRTPDRYWNGLNTHLVAEATAYERMLATNANVLHGCWPGVRTRQRCQEQGFVYSTMPGAKPDDLHPIGEEERIVFLHIAGRELRTTVASEEGHEDSRSNQREAETAVRIYKSLVQRLSSRRFAENTIGVLSQYRYQVSVIKRMLQQEGFNNPTVQTVIASQGSEFDYVILSLVRSLPDYEIPKCPLPGWENKYLGFITDENQINVALTRARRGLIIIGNRSLLRTNRMWSCLLDRLQRSGCIPAHPDDFPDRTGDRRRLSRSGQDDSDWQFSWRTDLQCFWPRGDRRAAWDWQQAGPPATAPRQTRQQQPLPHGHPSGAVGLRRPFSMQDEEFPELR